MTRFRLATIAFLVAHTSFAETRVGTTLNGLDRIDQRSGIKNNRFSVVRTGLRSTIWVLDDECAVTHPEFGGRATNAFAVPGQGGRQSAHATQMASIAAGSTIGVASQAQIRCVDMVAAGWSPANLTTAVDFILSQARTGAEVANISLIYPGDATVDAQVQRLITAGITVVVSAGNNAQPAANYSPARLATAITVGNLNTASATPDSWYSTSNYGASIDILAPGVSIEGADPGGGYAQYTDGTSQSAAHASGVAALYLDAFPGSTPAQVHSAIVNAATIATISGLPASTTNKILFADFMTPPDLDVPTPPITVSKRIGNTPAGPFNNPPTYFGGNEDSTRTTSLRDLPGAQSHYIGGLKQLFTSAYSCPLNPTKFLSHQKGYLTKLESTGTHAWHVTISPNDTYCAASVGLAEVVAVQVDTKGSNRDVFAAVRFTKVTNPSPSETRLQKYDSSTGALLFDVLIGTDLEVASITEAQIVGSGIYVVGTMTGANAGYTGLGGSDGFYALVDTSSGAITSKARFGTAANDVVRDALIVGDGSLIAVGSTAGNYSGTNAGGMDAFVAKVGPTVLTPIIYQQGTSADEVAVSVATGPGPGARRIFVVGNTNGSLEPMFPGHPGGNQDGFVWVIDENAMGTTFSKLFGRRLGSNNTDTLWSVRNYNLSNHNLTFIGGSTHGSLAGPNPGGRDALFGKLVSEPSQTPELRWLWQSAAAGEDEILDLDFGDASTGVSFGYVHSVGSSSGGFPPNTTPMGGSDGFRVRLTGY